MCQLSFRVQTGNHHSLCQTSLDLESWRAENSDPGRVERVELDETNSKPSTVDPPYLAEFRQVVFLIY